MASLDGMIIVIPTFNRVQRQVTLKETPKNLHKYVYLCCTKEEQPLLEKETGHKQFIIQPAKVKTIHAKRQFILEWCRDNAVKKVLMLDDDMFWQARGPKGLIKEYASETHVTSAMKEMAALLGEFAHAGFSSRLGNNRVESDYARTTRMMHSLGYNVKAFFAAKADFNRVHGKEDFDVTLQLLQKGYDNCVVYHTCVSPGKYDAPGGCSTERTLESANAAAEKLKSLHPEFVSVVEKTFKNNPRMEVMMKWKRAYAHGVSVHGEQRVAKKAGGLFDTVEKGTKV